MPPPPLPIPRSSPPPLPARGAVPPPLPSRGALPPPLPGKKPTPPPLPGSSNRPTQQPSDDPKKLPYNAPKILFEDGTEAPAPPHTRYTRMASRYTGIILNRWTSVQSTWLWSIKFEPYKTSEDKMPHEMLGNMSIEFVSGFIGLWPYTSLETYRSYVHTYSKGKFHYAAPWKSSYSTVRDAIYHGPALAARISQNT